MTAGAVPTARASANALPVPVLNINQSEVMTLEPLVIDATGSYDNDGVVAAYFFQFEDGTETGWITDALIKHTYLKERYYTIRLKVMDDRGEESSYWETMTVSVVNRLPHIEIESELKVKPNTPVILESYLSWDEDGYIINYTWEFEDNTTKYGPNVTHEFEEPGIYNIFITLLDDDRKGNKSSMRVIVEEPVASKKQTLRGIATVIVVASIGVLFILFFKRPAIKFERPKKFFSRGTDDIEVDEAELVQAHASKWFQRHGNNIPELPVINLPANAESFIYQLAVSDSKDQSERAVPANLQKTADGIPEKSRPSDHGLFLLSMALMQRVPPAKELNDVVLAYRSALKQIASHGDMGNARYYVPKTFEQEALAAFVVRKLKIRHGITGGGNFGDADKEYVRSIVDLLGKSWKMAHSFKARAHSDPAKLYITLLLCEKAGKRRFGAGRVEKHDVMAEDEELELVEDLLRMYNGIWTILEFEEFKGREEEARIICTLYLFELVGTQRYLGTHQHAEPKKKAAKSAAG